MIYDSKNREKLKSDNDTRRLMLEMRREIEASQDALYDYCLDVHRARLEAAAKKA